jgi:hypothetical protein
VEGDKVKGKESKGTSGSRRYAAKGSLGAGSNGSVLPVATQAIPRSPHNQPRSRLSSSSWSLTSFSSSLFTHLLSPSSSHTISASRFTRRIRDWAARLDSSFLPLCAAVSHLASCHLPPPRVPCAPSRSLLGRFATHYHVRLSASAGQLGQPVWTVRLYPRCFGRRAGLEGAGLGASQGWYRQGREGRDGR